jgi:hypothetical protein
VPSHTQSHGMCVEEARRVALAAARHRVADTAHRRRAETMEMLVAATAAVPFALRAGPIGSRLLGAARLRRHHRSRSQLLRNGHAPTTISGSAMTALGVMTASHAPSRAGMSIAATVMTVSLNLGLHTNHVERQCSVLRHHRPLHRATALAMRADVMTTIGQATLGGTSPTTAGVASAPQIDRASARPTTRTFCFDDAAQTCVCSPAVSISRCSHDYPREMSTREDSFGRSSSAMRTEPSSYDRR